MHSPNEDLLWSCGARIMTAEVAWRCYTDSKPLMDEVGVGGLVNKACDSDTGVWCLHPVSWRQSMLRLLLSQPFPMPSSVFHPNLQYNGGRSDINNMNNFYRALSYSTNSTKTAWLGRTQRDETDKENNSFGRFSKSQLFKLKWQNLKYRKAKEEIVNGTAKGRPEITTVRLIDPFLPVTYDDVKEPQNVQREDVRVVEHHTQQERRVISWFIPTVNVGFFWLRSQFFPNN